MTAEKVPKSWNPGTDRENINISLSLSLYMCIYCIYIYYVYTSIYPILSIYLSIYPIPSYPILSYPILLYLSINLSIYHSGQASVAKAPAKAVIAKAPFFFFFCQVPTSPNLELDLW